MLQMREERVRKSFMLFTFPIMGKLMILADVVMCNPALFFRKTHSLVKMIHSKVFAVSTLTVGFFKILNTNCLESSPRFFVVEIFGEMNAGIYFAAVAHVAVSFRFREKEMDKTSCGR